jgi:hypothetical protein
MGPPELGLPRECRLLGGVPRLSATIMILCSSQRLATTQALRVVVN